MSSLGQPLGERFWDTFKTGLKQIEMPVPQRRDAGEHAEDVTAEPSGVTFTSAPDVGGLWAAPDRVRPSAAILYLFGGGYILGSPQSRRKTAGHLALAAAARVLVPSYRLAPEDPFPAAIDDAVRAYKWMLAHGSESFGIVIAGDSSGGGLAVATALAIRDRDLPEPSGIVAISPWADLTCSGKSMTTRSATDFACTHDGLFQMAQWYDA